MVNEISAGQGGRTEQRLRQMHPKQTLCTFGTITQSLQTSLSSQMKVRLGVCILRHTTIAFVELLYS